MGKLDLTSGYHQEPLAKESRAYTAFITHLGVFEWNRVVMGQKGAGPWFQSILAMVVLLGLIYTICELYIYDLLVFSKSEDEFVENLDTVLGRLVAHNITVNPDKCELGVNELEFVGHVINEKGLGHTREKIDKILQIPPPTLGKDLKSFLGVAIWVCDHIPNYSTIVRPLHQMLKNYSRERRLVWTQEARDAFEELKTAINNCTLLYFIDDISEIKLYTDASDFGIGGYLCQIIEEKEVPIAFVSHSLSEQEINWSTIEKECYAIVFCLDKLNYLLDGHRFTLKTDHKNLTFMDADKNPKVKRWKLAIQHYDCIIEYIKGGDNIIADPMSRLVASNKGPANLIAALREVPEVLSALLERNLEEVGDTEEYLYVVRQNQLYPAAVREMQISPAIKAEIEAVHNGIVGHHGVQPTFDKLVRKGFHWPYMRQHVKYFIKKCCPFCQKMSYLKTPVQTNPFTTAAYAPMERQNWDSIGPLTLEDGTKVHILVAICCFTRWTELWVTEDVTMESVRLPILEHWSRFGEPSQILTDNGPQFDNQVVKELCDLCDVQHLTVLAYSKEENSMIERMNKEVMRHLRALVYEINTTKLTKLREMIQSVRRIINGNRTEPNHVSPAQ